MTLPPFKIDSIEPAAAPMRAPSPNATVAPGPTFVWGPSPADASGLVRYEVLVRIGGRFEAVARVPHTGASEYRTTQTVGPAIPNNTDLRWYVRTYYGAGNQGGSESQSRAFRVHPDGPRPGDLHRGPERADERRGPDLRVDRRRAVVRVGAVGRGHGDHPRLGERAPRRRPSCRGCPTATTRSPSRR